MNNTGLEMLRQLYLERKGSPNPGMKTDVDSCLWEIAEWFVKTRRTITEPELESILLKHCGSQAEVQKFTKFLETEPGQARFKTLLRERKEQPSPPWQPSYLKVGATIDEIMRAAVKDYAIYGDNGLDRFWTFDMTSDRRRLFEKWLVATGHPLASEVGTAEWRFKEYAKRLAEEEGFPSEKPSYLKEEKLPEFLRAYEPGWWEARNWQEVRHLVRDTIHEKYTSEDELSGIKGVPTKRGWYRRVYYLPEWSMVNPRETPRENKVISQYIVERGTKWQGAVGLFHLSRVKYDLVTQQGYKEEEVDAAINFLRQQGILTFHVDKHGRIVYGVIKSRPSYLKDIYIDDKDYPISAEDKRRISELAQTFWQRRYEYTIFVYESGKIDTCTDKHPSQCAVKLDPNEKLDIWLHNHPHGVDWPSLEDRFLLRQINPRIAGVYGRNERLRRQEVYIFCNTKEESKGETSYLKEKPVERAGRCYELALKHVLEQQEGTLIHGEVWNPKLGRMIGHAWVETETGYIYEPVSAQYFKKDWLYQTYKAKEFQRYTPEQAAIMAARTKNFGPWTEAERKAFEEVEKGIAKSSASYLKEKPQKRTAYYIHYWESDQPHYWSGPEEGGAFKSLDAALRAASLELDREHPEAYNILIYSQIEEWKPIEEWEEAYPEKGRWELIEGTEKYYNSRGAVIFGGEPSSYLKEETAIVPETECQIISPQYYDVLGWLNIPVPDYSFAIETEVKERKIDEVLQKLKDGVARIHESAIFREFLLTMSKFHHYSIGNQILIMLQKPNATRVAGIKTWNELGRYVKRGEKGIAILAPCLPPRILRCPLCEKTFTERDLRVHIEQLHPGADISQLVRQAKEEMEAVVPTPTYFKVVYVFDVSQTEGKPLPEFVVPTVTEFYNEDLYQRLMKLAEKYGLSISLEPKPELDPSIKGSLQGKNIWVKPDETPAQRLKTLGHEEAHYFTENVYFIPRADAEVIAESVAFVVCAHFGFDSGVRSFPYVALWAKEKKVLEQNLASIRKISGRMIEELA